MLYLTKPLHVAYILKSEKGRGMWEGGKDTKERKRKEEE